MARAKKTSLKELSSKVRASRRTDDGPDFTLENVHREIRAVRRQLIDNIPTEEIAKERVITAIRNLDLARVVLECNQSLSPLDYNIEPWDHLGPMGTILDKSAGKKGGNGKS
jgi:hypothetical protein